jgi:hypothetical protein
MAPRQNNRNRPPAPRTDESPVESPAGTVRAVDDRHLQGGNAGYMELRERPAPGAAWQVNPTEYAEFQVQRNLEQVGRILKRLELDQADIVQLRTETRAILAELAA